MIFLGCDGGSTKTELLIADDTGRVLAHQVFSGCNYVFLGRDGFARHMETAISSVLTAAQLTPADLTFSLFGLPVYGEVPETEDNIPSVLTAILGDSPYRIVNDSVVGWGGALGGLPGINIVAGTGSIVYGIDPAGKESRVSGWSLHFGDEGSCSWVGREVIKTFIKQADGRLPRTALYDVVREEFNLTNNLYFSKILQVNCREDSAQLAKMQLLALRAFERGDVTMRAIYQHAAEELADAVLTAKRQLDFPSGQPVHVSYSGGLFKAGEIILSPFRKLVEEGGCIFCTPRYSPAIGAVAVAAKDYLDADSLTRMLDQIDRTLKH